MAAKKYYRPQVIEFGGTEITLEPLRGLKAIKGLQDAMIDEITALQMRYETLGGNAANPEHLLVDSINAAGLIKIGCPAVTDELIENSMQVERLGLLDDILHTNGMGHLSPFVNPAMLIEIAYRMQKASSEILDRQFGSPESSENSSEQGSPGTTSTTS